MAERPDPQGDVDHLIALIRPLPEILRVLRGVDRGGFGKDMLFLKHLIDLIGDQVHAVAVCFAAQNDMKGIVLHVIPSAQLVTQIAGAVRTQNDFMIQQPVPPCVFYPGRGRIRHLDTGFLFSHSVVA